MKQLLFLVFIPLLASSNSYIQEHHETVPSSITVYIQNETNYQYEIRTINGIYHVDAERNITVFFNLHEEIIITAYDQKDAHLNHPFDAKPLKISRLCRKIILKTTLHGWEIKTSLWPFKLNRHTQ